MPHPRCTGQPQPAIKLELDGEGLEANDNGDEIVREMDVFLSPAMASHMYLMQYPLQHRRRPGVLPEAARIKPGHGMIELEERIPTQGQGLFPLVHSLQKSRTIPVSTHLCLGKITGESLTLVPLSHVVQMRPSFDHVNDVNGTQEEDDDMDEHEQEFNKLEKKPVMFQKKESERAALARKSSFAYQKLSEESEPWQELVICAQPKQATDRVLGIGDALALPSRPLLESNSFITNADFLASLNYLPADTDTTMAEDMIVTSDQVCAQLATLLQRALPVPYSVLKDKFPDDDSLLPAMLSTCVSCRGNFLLQSRFLPLTPALQQARTFILLVLQNLGHVERTRLSGVFPEMSPEAIEMLLEQVALKHLNGWQPKLQDNPEFCEFFPRESQLYPQYWERQATRFDEQYQLYKDNE
jgi:DNA-directed RNA polymerase-3 subunit RPC5